MLLAIRPVSALISGSCGASPENSRLNLSYFHWISISHRPLFDGALVQKRWVLGAGSTWSRIRCSMANEEVRSDSAASRIVEKELKFSPAFDDYVKALESVRTYRSKGFDGNEGNFDSKKRSIGKGKSIGTKKRFCGNRDDSEERANVRNNNSRGERIDYSWENKELKGKVGVTKDKSNDAWGLGEGHLEKGTAGRMDGMGKGNLENNNSSHIYASALRTSNLQRKIANVGENVNNGRLVKGNVSYLRRSKDMQREKSKEKEIDKLEICRQDNDKMDQRKSSISRRKFSDENYKIAHEEPIETKGAWSSNNNSSDDLSDHDNDKYSQRRKVGKKIYDYRTKNLAERLITVGGNEQSKLREPEIINDEQILNIVYGNDMSNKATGLGIGKSTVDGKGNRMMDHGDTGTRWRKKRREFEFEDDYGGQNRHVNYLIGKPNNHIEHAVKQNNISSLKISDGQNRNEWHVGTYDGGNNTTKTHSKVNLDDASGDVDDNGIDDRAAFKTFEVFTDVRNRQRVLRMEMEERIQQVAKQLHAADKNIPQWKFSKILHSAKIRFTDHSILRIVQILGELGNWKRALRVVQWLQSSKRLQSYKRDKSRYIYTSLLDVLGKARRPKEALKIFGAMLNGFSSYPDLAAYHCIATILGQAGRLKELFDVIDCMRTLPKKKFKRHPGWDPRLEPDLVVYHAVLNGCVKEKQWEGAFWVLQEMKQHGIKPTNTTYGHVMEVMLACEKYNLVHEIFRKVGKRSIPGALNYKVLINTLWREGKTDEAVAAVKDMERRGIVGTASLYNDLARCLCSVGRCQEGLLQINKICKVANKPLVVTYTGLIQACLNSGSIENSTFIFNQMHKFCSPNIITCNIMLKAYIDHEMFEEAKNLFQKIFNGDYQITNRAGLPQKLAPDKFTFNTMIEGYAQAQKWDDFDTAYRQMLNRGHHFDTRRHLRLVLDACRAGKVRVMESTWKHLVCFLREPPVPLIKERFCMKLIEDDYVAALSCIDIQQMDIRAFSEKSWLNLLNAYADRFKSDTVIRLANELDALTPQNVEVLPVYENLRKACAQFVSDANTTPALSHHPDAPCNM